MFQNMQNNYASEEKVEKKLRILSNVFSKKYIALYAITFMVSTIGIGQDVSPFSIAIVASVISNTIPAIAVLAFALIGNIVGIGWGSAINYILILLIFFASFFISQPNYNDDDKNEKIKLGKRIFFCTLIFELITTFLSGFMLYDLFVSITMSLIVLVFYKIFVNSIIVISEFKEKKAFTIEEVIGASVLIAIAVCSFGEFKILGFSVRNVLSIFIVLVLGWKNGILIGTTSGVTIGATLGIIASNEPIVVAAYAISGLTAGILNKFGRIGVIVGFILGNCVLSYITSGGVAYLILFKEILVASVGLLAIPKNIELNIESIIGDNKLLPEYNNRGLNKSKETVDRLNKVSKAIHEMADAYKGAAATTIDEEDIKQKNKQIFISELLDRIDNLKENILYDYISDTEGSIVNDIFNRLNKKQVIKENDLIDIFSKYNKYIISSKNEKIDEDTMSQLKNMVNAINYSYNISKVNFIWTKKLEEEKNNIGAQLNSVSKAISNIALDMESNIEDEDKYIESKEQILSVLRQKNIIVEELSIIKRKDSRYIVDMYIENNAKEETTSFIQTILIRVLKEKLVLNEKIEMKDEKCTKLTFISDDKYTISIGQAFAVKDNMPVSGDSMLQIKLKDGKYLLAISDGMGSGPEARKSSQIAIKMLERLLTSGFEKNTSVELINSGLLNTNDDVFATLDIAIIDLYKGNIEFIKSGACPTYIKNKRKIQIIKSLALPAGIISDASQEVFDRDIEEGDILFMCSDGILDSNVEYKNKELWVKYILEDIETENVQKIADIILNEAVDNTFGKVKDDMSIFTCKFIKK